MLFLNLIVWIITIKYFRLKPYLRLKIQFRAPLSNVRLDKSNHMLGWNHITCFTFITLGRSSRDEFSVPERIGNKITFEGIPRRKSAAGYAREIIISLKIFKLRWRNNNFNLSKTNTKNSDWTKCTYVNVIVT